MKTGLLGLVCILASASAASAQQAPPAAPSVGRKIGVSFEECDDLSTLTIQELVAVELKADLEEAPEAQATRAVIVCSSPRAKIRVVDPLTEKSLERSVALPGGKGRERLLAIATSELIFASWLELATESETRTPPISEEVREAQGAARELVASRAREASSDKRERSTANNAIEGVASVRGLHGLGSPLLGVGLRWTHDTDTPLSLSIGAEGETARVQVSPGSAAVTHMSALGAAYYRLRRDHFVARFGGGLRAGAAFAAATPTDPSLFQGRNLASSVLGISGLAALGYRAGPLALDVGVEVGGLSSPLRGTGASREITFRGLHAAATFAAGIFL